MPLFWQAPLRDVSVKAVVLESFDGNCSMPKTATPDVRDCMDVPRYRSDISRSLDPADRTEEPVQRHTRVTAVGCPLAFGSIRSRPVMAERDLKYCKLASVYHSPTWR